jgi:hypothetical protein
MADVFADEHFDPKRDLPKERKIEVENGSPFLVRQEDPFGFWYVRREHGQVPEKLQGAYTTFGFANDAVQLHVNSQKKKAN